MMHLQLHCIMCRHQLLMVKSVLSHGGSQARTRRWPLISKHAGACSHTSAVPLQHSALAAMIAMRVSSQTSMVQQSKLQHQSRVKPWYASAVSLQHFSPPTTDLRVLKWPPTCTELRMDDGRWLNMVSQESQAEVSRLSLMFASRSTHHASAD